MARIISEIPPSDPITEAEIEKIEHYFETRLNLLWEQVENIRIPMLIGCSGAFDTLADLIDQTDAGTKTRIDQELKMHDFEMVCDRLIASTTNDRLQMKGMESIRVEMIVPAVLFIRKITDRLNIKKIVQTDFALREGILYEHIFS